MEIYGLYKQVTCFGEFKNAVKPAFWRFGECRKYWAWESCNKLSKYEALDEYVKTVRRVCPDWKYDPGEIVSYQVINRDAVLKGPKCRTFWKLLDKLYGIG